MVAQAQDRQSCCKREKLEGVKQASVNASRTNPICYKAREEQSVAQMLCPLDLLLPHLSSLCIWGSVLKSHSSFCPISDPIRPGWQYFCCQKILKNIASLPLMSRDCPATPIGSVLSAFYLNNLRFFPYHQMLVFFCLTVPLNYLFLLFYHRQLGETRAHL